MGSWNGNCAVSNLHIHYGQRVVIFMLQENKHRDSFCHTNAYYNYCPMPFYGEYNDYGAAENCSGYGLPLIIESIRENLMEFELGENQYHDVPVKKDEFNVELLFEADHENRLALYSKTNVRLAQMLLHHATSPIEKAEAEANIETLKTKGTRIAPVMIHGDVFDYILDNVTQEFYYRNEDGKFVSHEYKFQDLVDSLPEFIVRLRCAMTDKYFSIETSVRQMFQDNEVNYAARWLGREERDTTFLFNLGEVAREQFPAMADSEIKEFLTEYSKGLWMNAYLERAHKVWLKPSSGSQDNDHTPYQILHAAVAGVLAKEKAEWGEENCY